MDWLCPGYSEVLARQINRFHGKLTADVIIREIVSIEQSGSLHIAVYDLVNDFVYIANARGTLESGPLDAYDRYCLWKKSLFTLKTIISSHSFSFALSVLVRVLALNGEDIR